MTGIDVNNLMNRPLCALTLSLCLVCTGCVIIPIPTGQTIPEERYDFIAVGSTTKSEVLARLGPPSLFRLKNTLVYEERAVGLYVFVAVYQGGGGVGEALIKHASLVVRFDDNDVVSEAKLQWARPLSEFDDPGEALKPPFRRWRLPLLEYLPNGVIAAADYRHGDLFLWDLASRRMLGQYAVGSEPDLLTVAPDGAALASVNTNRSDAVQLWDIASGQLTATLSREEDNFRITSIAFSPDGEMIAVAGNDGSVTTWKTATGEPLLRLAAHRPKPPMTHGGALSVLFSPDNRLLATTGYRKDPPADPLGPWNALEKPSDIVVKLWDAATGSELVMLEAHVLRGYWRYGYLDSVGMAFAADGKQLALNCGRHVEVWDISPATASNGSEAFRPRSELPHPLLNLPAVIPLQGPDYWGGPLTFSPDGRLLAVARRSVTLRNLITGETWLVDKPSSNALWRKVSFSPDGKLLLTGERSSSFFHPLKARLFRVSEARARAPPH